MIIRNDDVAADTTLREIRTFCEICDRYGVTPMHAITPIGNVRGVDCRWDNATIRERTGTALFSENHEVVEYLRKRPNDHYAIHGLWHTHNPTRMEISAAYQLLLGTFRPTGYEPRGWWFDYFVPPFNEWDESELSLPEFGVLPDSQLEIEIVGAGIPRLEEHLDSGTPVGEIVYLHSWRFEHGPFTWDQLDRCLARLTRQ